MLKIPKKALDRFVSGLKQYQPVLHDVVSRDVSEADTVTVVKDILADLFGFNKYTELTGEQQIRGTFCDLAVVVDGTVKFLIEVKSAGSSLSDIHIRQAVNYGVHKGIEWIVLTNGSEWRLYRLTFGQPVSYDEVALFDLRTLDHKSEEELQKAFLLSREAIGADAMNMYHQNALLFNKFTVTHILLTDSVLTAIRREFRRIFPDLRVDGEKLSELLKTEILKRELLEGDKSKECSQRIRKAQQKLARIAAKKEKPGAADVVAELAEPVPDIGESSAEPMTELDA